MNGVPFAFWKPTPSAPSLSVSLSKDGPDPIALSASLGVTAIVTGGTAAATFTIESGPGSLSAVTGTTATFDADPVTSGITVVRATHDDDPLVFDEVTIVTDPDLSIAPVTTDAPSDTIADGLDCIVTATPVGGSAAATFSINSGSGTLTGATATTVQFLADFPYSGPVEVRATHNDDALVFADVTIQVRNYGLSLNTPGGSLANGGTWSNIMALLTSDAGMDGLAVTFSIQSGPGSLTPISPLAVDYVTGGTGSAVVRAALTAYPTRYAEATFTIT